MAEVPDTPTEAIEALGDAPTADEVFRATLQFETRDVAAAAATLGGGGGGPTLIGPFRVDYDDPNVGSDVTNLVELTAGDLVLAAHIIVVAAWECAGPFAGFYVSVDTDGAGSGGANIVEYNHANANVEGGEPGVTGDAGYTNYRAAAMAASGSHLRFEAYPDSGSFTAGSADIYALVVTP